MWLHPPFFSIGVSHLGHSLVFKANQLDVPLSSLFFFAHFFTALQSRGSCHWEAHLAQTRCPLEHVTP